MREEESSSNTECPQFPHRESEGLTSFLNKDHIWPNIVRCMILNFLVSIHWRYQKYISYVHIDTDVILYY